MKHLCKESLWGGVKSAMAATAMLSLGLFASCTDEDGNINMPGNRLQLSFNVAQPQSRTIITGNTLPDASVVGVRLDDDEATDYDDYAALAFTASTVDDKQVWTPNTDVVLSETEGTIYAYWPYSSTTDITAIPVDVTAADQTDWLYATPVENVNENNASVPVTLNHMLTNVKVAINRGTYVGTGNISNITIQSDGFATGGTFNAAQATPAFTAVTGTGDALSRTVTATLGGAATDIMVVPTGTSKAVTFTATIDDVDYTVTSSDVELEEGKSYEYTLSLNSTFMSVASVAVNPWTSVPKESLTLEKDKSGPAINSVGKANGVYAVTATGELIVYNDAAVDATCLGVALITDNQRIMIEKNGEANTTSIKAAYEADGATDTGYKYFYWGPYGADVDGIDNKSDGTAAKTDFAGKANTAALLEASYTDGYTTYANMAIWCRIFNQTATENQGYTDWYIPACGQLYEIYTNKTYINTALTAMSGTAFSEGYYWSSSENSGYNGWFVDFVNDYVGNAYGKGNNDRVRFVRDI